MSLDDRMDHVEERLAAVHTEVRGLRDAQDETTRELSELKPLVGELAAQSTALVTISASMVRLREEVTKWAAAGALVGSVMLFIAVRALGI